MFKNAMIYRISSMPEIPALKASLEPKAYEPCGVTQERSSGWVPPRGQEHGVLAESIDGNVILKLMTEIRKVPAQTIKDKVDQLCKSVEEMTGRKPGKKERRDMADEARLSLLPHAFSTKHATTLWIDRKRGILVVDAASQTKADDAVTMLVQSIDGAVLQMISTNTSPAAAMAYWLSTKESPNGFTVERECELRACDESKSVVRYGRHPLDTDEVAAHIKMGKLPTRLALTFEDRVSFVMNDSMHLKKIAILDIAFTEGNPDGVDGFDADVVIATRELSILIEGLIEVLGGEVAQQETKPE